MRNRCKRTYKLNIFTFASGKISQLFHKVCAIICILECFNIIVTNTCIHRSCFMSNYFDSLFFSFLKYRCKRFRIKRNYTDCIPVLCQKRFYIWSLVRTFCWAAIENIRSVFIVVLVYAIFHSLEPCDVCHFRYNCNLVILSVRRHYTGACTKRCNCCRRCTDTNNFL